MGLQTRGPSKALVVVLLVWPIIVVAIGLAVYGGISQRPRAAPKLPAAANSPEGAVRALWAAQDRATEEALRSPTVRAHLSCLSGEARALAEAELGRCINRRIENVHKLEDGRFRVNAVITRAGPPSKGERALPEPITLRRGYLVAQEDDAWLLEVTLLSCPTCGGHWDRECGRCSGDGKLDDGEECPLCEGEGWHPCPECGSRGEILVAPRLHGVELSRPRPPWPEPPWGPYEQPLTDTPGPPRTR